MLDGSASKTGMALVECERHRLELIDERDRLQTQVADLTAKLAQRTLEAQQADRARVFALERAEQAERELEWHRHHDAAMLRSAAVDPAHQFKESK